MQSSALQKQVYQKAWELEPDYKVAEKRLSKVRKIFADLNKIKILDVGCGDGTILAPFATKHDLYGVDIAESAVTAAKARGIKAFQHDLEAPLPFEPHAFDAVFCGETIEHYPDTDWLLSEINRVLKPGGLLALTYPNIRTLLGVLMLVFFDAPPMYAARYRAPHYRDFTLKTVKIALKNNQFEFVRAQGCAFYVPRIGECAGGLASFIPSWSSCVLVQARKIGTASYDPRNSTGEIY